MKLLEENIGSKLFDITLSNIFLGLSPWARETGKKEHVELYKTKKVLHNEWNNQESKKIMYWMRKIYKWYIQ